MAAYYSFAGLQIDIPGSYTQRLFPVNQGNGNGAGKVILIGESATGGVPYNASSSVNDIINIIDGGQAQALNVFGGGNLYYGTEFYLTPTKDSRFNTPSEALCICVNQMTQAKFSLLNSAAPIIDVAFDKYGTDGNQSAVKVSAGSVTGSLLQLLYKGVQVLNQDNVAMPLFTIQYIGAGSAASMTINGTTLTTTITGAVSDNLSLTLANFTDLSSFINLISQNPAYTCTLNGNSDELPSILDALTAVDMKTAPVVCNANVEAIIRAINASNGFSANLHALASRLIPTNMTAYAFLSGGTVTPAVTSDWIAVLKMLENYELDNIVALTGSITIQDLVQVHVDAMNATNVGKCRQTGFGNDSTAATKALQIAQMKALNSANVEYCVSSFSRFDYVNNVVPTTNFQPFLLYPMIAGFRYANAVGMDLVFKYLNVLSTPEINTQDQKDYAAAGATFIQNRYNATDGTQNFEIAVNNTTYQGSQVTRTNPACVYEINRLTKDYNAQVIEKLRGLTKVANSVTISTIQNWILTYLFPLYRDDYKWITDSIDPTTGKTIPAFQNVSFTDVGEVFQTIATLTMSVTPRYAFNTLTFITPGQSV